MLEFLAAMGVDPQLLFWAFLGSICSIFVGPKNLWANLGSIVVGTVFGTGFGAYVTKYTGLPPAPTALVIGLTGMIIARVLKGRAEKFKLPAAEKNT